MSAEIRGFYVDDEVSDVHAERPKSPFSQRGVVRAFCGESERLTRVTQLDVFAPTRTRSICAPCVTAIEREHVGRKA